jgi:IclR family transcriptional regulator, KDG regulon repressor
VEQENMKSLMKTFDILDYFLRGPEEISVTEVSQSLGLNKTTVNRIMLKLLDRGYLKQIEKRGKYTLGSLFLDFSGVIKSRLRIRDIALPHLLELSRKVKESTMMAVWDKRSSVITESFHDAAYLNSPLKIVPDEGVSMPLYCTCLGKILLANMTEKELEEYFINTKFVQRTANTFTDCDKIMKQLSKIRIEGVAYDDEEYAVGMRGVAASILNNEAKVVGSIAVLAPSVRLSPKEMLDIIPVVKDSSILISRELGYRDR